MYSYMYMYLLWDKIKYVLVAYNKWFLLFVDDNHVYKFFLQRLTTTTAPIYLPKSYACESQTPISRQLTPMEQFLTPKLTDLSYRP